MPGIVRKLLIFAAADGLILQPLAPKGQRPVPPVKISYKGASIGQTLADGASPVKSFEAFGIVGLLTVFQSSYLISITRRQQVAQIHGKPIYVITQVALTPLSSKIEADIAISNTHEELQKRVVDEHAMDESDSDDDDGEFPAAVSDDVEDEEHTANLMDATIQVATNDQQRDRASRIAEDVMKRKGGYGIFAQKWFSRRGWTAGQRRNLGMSADSAGPENKASVDGVPVEEQTREISEPAGSTEPKGNKTQSDANIAATLLPKLLRTAQILFGSSRSFYFCYDYDITRSFGNRNTTSGSETSLFANVDPLFFWNRNVIRPFIDAGQSSFVLPLLQGFVCQISFTVEKNPQISIPECCEKNASGPAMEMKALSGEDERPAKDASRSPTESQDSEDSIRVVTRNDHHSSVVEESTSFLLTLISRRSVKRAGLRYLRRGVDEDGNTANSVETEQILSSPNWSPSSKTYSFLQVRGSIPVFFSQSPYSFKPVPQLQHSADLNLRAFQSHFSGLSERYGSVISTSLVEKHGPEAIVGEEYQKNMERLNEVGGINGNKVGFEWFDFHAICRGMKFENVNLLLDSLGPTLDSFGTTVDAGGKLVQKQTGILRTNCMDCLDRTNVVQSAFGRRALELQLKEEGIDLSAQIDQKTAWFNTLWADNGDAISKQYASTAALKGDFTRTRKRNYQGALTDMGLSISRFYSGIVNDYFSQAAIDFFVGNVTSLVFEDFESNMITEDPGVSMQKMRQHAIEVSQRLVVADDDEEFIGGWALLSPHAPNTIKSMPFEESVLLLTDTALYACRFDWNMEKVLSFERVDLRHISSIRYGTYITSTLSPAQADEKRNVGFVVTYRAGVNDITKVNTRSMSTAPIRQHSDLLQGMAVTNVLTGLAGGKPPNNRVLALKAIPARSATADGQEVPRMTEIEQVKHICSEIERLALAGDIVESGVEQMKLVEQSDIITLAEAKKSTGLFEHMGHSLKKLVWA